MFQQFQQQPEQQQQIKQPEQFGTVEQFQPVELVEFVEFQPVEFEQQPVEQFQQFQPIEQFRKQFQPSQFVEFGNRLDSVLHGGSPGAADSLDHGERVHRDRHGRLHCRLECHARTVVSDQAGADDLF